MNWIRSLALSAVLAFTGPAFSEEFSTNEPRWKQLSHAYGFVLGQRISLELIEQEFPDLKKDVESAWFSFNSTALGESMKGVEEELSKMLGNEWFEYKKKMIAQMDMLIGEQDLTRQQAVDFLQEVHQRARGEIPEPILATLLSAHSRFTRNPGLELSAGWKRTFRTKDHPKSKGVDFSISFPVSWSRREGYRPNVIQFFQSRAGYGPIMCSLMVKDIPLPEGYKLSENEVKDFFMPNELKHLVSDNGVFIDAKTIVLEGAPAGMLISDQKIQRLDLTLSIRTTQFITIQGKSMIFIQFMLPNMPNSDKSMDELQQKYLPTYRSIVNTFVLNAKYK